jgi:uncharacterized protein (DUF488 family)
MKPVINTQPSTNKKVILTVGHSTHDIDEFIAILRAHGIERLVDIRSIPGSRHNPQFNRDALSRSLRNHKISYRHLARLGGRRHALKTSINMGWRNASFRGYADYMQTSEFQHGLERLIELAKEKSTAIMCAEAVPWRCHRSLVADALIARGFKVIDIMSITSAKKRNLNSMAVVQKKKVIYPAESQAS